MIHDGIHCRPDGPSGKEHVIHQDHLLVFDGEGDVRLPHRPMPRVPLEVVPVEGDVHSPHLHLSPLDGLQDQGEFLGEIGPAGPDAGKDQVIHPLVLFEDLQTQ